MTTSSPDFVGYLTDVRRRDPYVEAFIESVGGRLIKSKPEPEGVPVFMGLQFGCDELMVRCMKEGRDFVYIDHAYSDRGYGAENMRVIRGAHHRTSLGKYPGDRVTIKPLPWRKGKKIVVIQPSPKMLQMFDCGSWVSDVLNTLSQHTDRPIVIRQKNDHPSFLELMRDTHCVICHSSVAGVEAALNGVPVFSTRYCPALPIAEVDLTKVETPVYTDREAWLRTLSYSQFRLEEIRAGLAYKVLYGLRESEDERPGLAGTG